MSLERVTKVQLPFDMRAQGGGFNGLEVWFIVKGAKGAVQFMVYFPAYLPNVQKELVRDPEAYHFKIQGYDVGYHSRVPMYEGHPLMDRQCKILGCECYYDGSTLRAQAWVDRIFSVTGQRPDDLLWEMLENEYEAVFGEGQN